MTQEFQGHVLHTGPLKLLLKGRVIYVTAPGHEDFENVTFYILLNHMNILNPPNHDMCIT